MHTLALLANRNEKPLSSEFIACLVKTNAVVIRRLLSDLSGANLITTQTGASGGSKLAKSPSEILLIEVYRAVESPEIFALHRHKPDTICDIGRSIQTVLGEIQDLLDAAIDEKLTAITLAEVLQMIETENKTCLEKFKGENL